MSVRPCDISQLNLIHRYQCNLVILIFFYIIHNTNAEKIE
jgi:hypothetical protein